jgi:pyrrolidone-carboxylate peptidase
MTHDGFIHVPLLPEQVVTRASPAPSMSLETMISGVSAAIAVLEW